MIYAEWNEKRTRHRLLYDDAMSPLDYEHFCARRLESYGWKAEVTRASRDQGADIVASSGGIRAVIQAKKYRSRVGNDAVQQIYAAMRYYDAVPAAVVSTADFTASARVLARSTGVLLLHHDQLSNLQPQARMGLAPESPPTLRPALWNQPNAERRKR